MKIKDITLGGDNPCVLIGELGHSHNGKLDRLKRLMDDLLDVGVSLQKIQTFEPAELVALRGNGPAPAPWNDLTMEQLYAKVQLPPAWLPELFRHAESQGIVLFSSVFGATSLQRLLDVGCPALKLAALDFGKVGLYQMALDTRLPLLASCPTPTRPFGSYNVEWLYCPPGYPQTALHLKNLRNGFLGLSYHGTSYVEVMTAVAVGAKCVEVHCMPEDRDCIEAHVSWTPTEIGRLLEDIDAIEELLA